MHALQHTELNESRPSFSSGRKLTIGQQVVLWMLCEKDRTLSSKQLILQAETEYSCFIQVSLRHVNRWRAEWQLSRQRGRPRRRHQLQHIDSSGVLWARFNLPCVGLQLFVLWLQQLPLYQQLVDALQQAIDAYRKTHPGESFPLLYHRPQTLLLRFLALLLAPLFGIRKLTEYDVVEHPLFSMIGKSFQSSTLNQFLGQLERVDASSYLMPLLWSEQKGSLGYIDGHMIAFWTSQKMHKGLITMLGRVMAGSNAVVTHNEHGTPLYFEYFAPDYCLPTLIVEYCQSIVESIGIKLFIIDREVNSLQIAMTFTNKGWGLLCMFDKNEYDGFESFTYEVISDGDDEYPIYRAWWKDEDKKKNDPRNIVLMEKDEKVLAYWATNQFKEEMAEKDWPELYSSRNNIQENGFKRMIAHGALNTNYGTKKIEGPDRHQERRKEKLQQEYERTSEQWEKVKTEVELQKEKIQESEEKAHGIRLTQRKNKLVKLEERESVKQEKKEALEAKLEQEKEPKRRQDRDFRKQQVMTFRTLLLDQLLQTFFGIVMGPVNETVSMDRLLKLFGRSGGYVEKESEWKYWIDTDGLSKKNQILLEQLIGQLNEMNLMDHGKPVKVRLREGPE